MYNLQKLVMGGFINFAEKGKVVGGTTVGVSAYPDVSSPENWNSLGDVSEVDFEAEKETDTDYVPSPLGGYDKVDDERVVKDVIKFKTLQHSEPFWRMMMGLKNEIVNGTAQTPYAAKSRWIEGWLKVQGRGDNDGADRIIMNVYGRLSIDANPKWSKDPTKPALMFQQFYSPIATLEPKGIV